MSFESIKNLIQIIQALISTTAIIVAGIWAYRRYIFRGERYPRITIKHEVISRAVAPDRFLIFTIVSISNEGYTPLSTRNYGTSIRQLVPVPVDVLNTSKLLSKEGDVSTDGFPLLGRSHKIPDAKKRVEIYPMSTETISHAFFVTSEVKTILVDTYLGYPFGIKTNDWTTISVHDLK